MERDDIMYKNINDRRLQYIAMKIKQKREQSGMTQVQLADKANIARTTLGNYESVNDGKISITNLYAIADALCVPITEFLLPDYEMKNDSYDIFTMKEQTLENSNEIKSIYKK